MNNSQDNHKQDGREMGLILAAVLLVFALYPAFHNGVISSHYALSSLIVIAINIVVPQIFFPFYCIWMKLANILSKVISPIFLGVMFFAFFTPMGLMLRLFGKDLLGLHPREKAKRTFWKDKDKSIPDNMSKQF